MVHILHLAIRSVRVSGGGNDEEGTSDGAKAAGDNVLPPPMLIGRWDRR